jgi:hypothetical protein
MFLPGRGRRFLGDQNGWLLRLCATPQDPIQPFLINGLLNGYLRQVTYPESGISGG